MVWNLKTNQIASKFELPVSEETLDGQVPLLDELPDCCPKMKGNFKDNNQFDDSV